MYWAWKLRQHPSVNCITGLSVIFNLTLAIIMILDIVNYFNSGIMYLIVIVLLSFFCGTNLTIVFKDKIHENIIRYGNLIILLIGVIVLIDSTINFFIVYLR